MFSVTQRFSGMMSVITSASLGLAPLAYGQSSPWEWPDQGVGVLGSGAGYYVSDMVVWNDGAGPALYVGGIFTHAGGKEVNYIARWDGNAWSDLAGGLGYGPSTMVVFDDGSGPALFVAEVPSAGGLSVNGVARWNGSSWSGLGEGVCCGIRTLGVFDDGSGPALYALLSYGLRKWDGAKWTSFPGLVETSFRAMAVYDDGTGKKLYVGGNTIGPNGLSPFVAGWDGKVWLPTGGLVGVNTGTIEAMAAFDDGEGQKLFVGGIFDNGFTTGIAVLNGKSWTKPDAGLSNDFVGYDFAVVGSGASAALYVCGGLSAARWKGGTWEMLEAVGVGGPVAGAGYDDGKGARLHVGGSLMLGAGTGNWTNIARLKSATGGNRTCGDLNGDGFVNQQDLGVLLGDFGCTKGVGLCPGDCDNDGDTDQADLGILLANWEKACP